MIWKTENGKRKTENGKRKTENKNKNENKNKITKVMTAIVAK